MTNDGKLRRDCRAENVHVLWGLEPMIELVATGHLSAAEAKRVAFAIQKENPVYITAAVVRAFAQKTEMRLGHKKQR